MKELIETIAQALVAHPDQVRVDRQDGDDALIFRIAVAKEDAGKLIGKQGRVIKAIRSLVVAANPDSKRVVLEVIQ
jgi:predicted RNA-binding protein YlqC (UPF0109 family)